MKFKSFFLLSISLTTVSSLVDLHPASAGKCPGSDCPVYTWSGPVRGGGTLPEELLKQLKDLIAQNNFREAETVLRQFFEKVEIKQDLNRQAAVHQAVADLYTNQAFADLYTRRNQMDLASSHLTSAKALYQRVGNTQRFMEVGRQLQKVQHRQRQLRQRQLHQR